jgi:hypothetical protein
MLNCYTALSGNSQKGEVARFWGAQYYTVAIKGAIKILAVFRVCEILARKRIIGLLKQRFRI